jgi:hypothetical protein
MGIVNSHERGPRRVVRETDGSLTPLVTGDTPHDAVDTGYPHKIGGKASASLPAAVSSGDRVDAYFDVRGRTFVLPGSQAAAAANVHAPAANTAAVVTYSAAGTGLSHSLSGVAWSYSGDPTGGNLKIEDGSGTTVFSVDVTSKGPGFFLFPEPLRGAANTALIVTLAAGGSGVSGKVNVLGKRTE